MRAWNVYSRGFVTGYPERRGPQMQSDREHIYRIEYRIEQHQKKLRQAIKRAQQAVREAEGGQHVRIG